MVVAAVVRVAILIALKVLYLSVCLFVGLVLAVGWSCGGSSSGGRVFLVVVA